MATRAKTVTVLHPVSGEEQQIKIPGDHDGSRVKVEFPDGATTYTEGWDPAEAIRALSQFVVNCANCGADHALTSSRFVCSACGAENHFEIKTSSDEGSAEEQNEG